VLDDLADLKHDRLRKPERGLSTGRIDARALAYAGLLFWLLGLALLLENGMRGPLAWLAASLLSLSYYAIRQRLVAWLRPLWLNAPYLVLTQLTSFAEGAPNPSDLLLALFVWLAVVSQDFAHSIETDDQPYQPSGLSAGAHAKLGVAFWSAAQLSAGGFELRERDPFFGGVLALLTPWLLVLLLQLAHEPNSRRARRLYVPGGLFFILPLLGRLCGGLLGS
jgi:hypothetical protein